MTVSLKKWGNSLALRMPKDIAKTLQVKDGSTLEMEVVDGALVLKPIQENHLQTLVAQITDENLHQEIDTGKRVGNEAW